MGERIAPFVEKGSRVLQLLGPRFRGDDEFNRKDDARNRAKGAR
jgi:hypothetical protein